MVFHLKFKKILAYLKFFSSKIKLCEYTLIMVLHLIYFENQCVFFFCLNRVFDRDALLFLTQNFVKKFNMTNEKISLLS